MVDIITAYRIVNRSIARVAADMVCLDVLETDSSISYVRLEEATYSVAEIQQRLDNTVVVAHELSQYINRFYSINMKISDTVWFDDLLWNRAEKIDLTEFGEFV